MQKIVFFDIDYTLFDVSHFDINFHKMLADLFSMDQKYIEEVSFAIIRELVKEESYLNVDKYIDKLLRLLGKKEYKSEVEKFLFGGYFFKAGFYPDVDLTLKSLKSLAKLGIFSQGDEKLQLAKIRQSGFMDVFDKSLIYVIKPKKLDFMPSFQKLHKNDKVYLVEDRPSVVDWIKKNFQSIFVIWIKRGKYQDLAKDVIDFKPDAIIENLEDVVSIVKNN